MRTQIHRGVAIILIVLCLSVSGCQGAPIKNNTPTDVVRSFLIAIKNRDFEEADTYMLSYQNSSQLLSAHGIFKETQDFHFSGSTLKMLDDILADYIFSIQGETIQDQSATVFISIKNYDLKHAFDRVKSTIFNDARNADTPLDAITLDTQVDPALNRLLKNKEGQQINTGVSVHLIKKDHRWFIDNQTPNNRNRAFFAVLIGK